MQVLPEELKARLYRDHPGSAGEVDYAELINRPGPRRDTGSLEGLALLFQRRRSPNDTA